MSSYSERLQFARNYSYKLGSGKYISYTRAREMFFLENIGDLGLEVNTFT